MSLLKNIQLFIANNPGLTNKQLAASMPQFDVHAVQRGVCHLVKLNRATRKHNGKCYQYFAKPPSGEVGEVISRVKIDRAQSAASVEIDSVVNPALAALMLKAQGLTEKGLFHRAATVLMEAFNRSKNEDVREKILVERQKCLSKVKKPKAPSDDLCMAGKGARGI
ncbi:PerC family transcriptional regulator [Escherichia coli]|uniref:PerC family transcriptional regulator n=1 Tax=Escherichia coli TaxID=562 RepID=UPI0035A3F081